MADRDEDKYEMPEIQEANHDDSTRISDDVIATIAATVLSEIQGVASVPGGIVSGILGRKGASKGIKVEASDQEVVIDVAVIMNYGTKIPEVAAQVQTKIREAVEEITGMYVRAVNVSVQGMRLPETVQPRVEELARLEKVEPPSETKPTMEEGA
ncbi:MAG: Asp23/Gls24 family envelope stress response protein [bacterium]|nr:Asp23/Gls24 family envelope stress response protein [bacterium]